MDRHNHNPPPEELDELIRRALADELRGDGVQLTDDESRRVARLRQFWLEASGRELAGATPQHRGVWRAAMLAAAASLVVAAWLAWSNETQQLANPNGGDRPEHPEPQAMNPAGESQVTGDAAAPPPSVSAGRAPTAYERMLFVARTRTRLPAPAPEGGPLKQDPQQWIAQALRQMQANPQVKIAALQEVPPNRQKIVSLLLAKLPTSPAAQQTAICQLLGALGDERAVPGLLKLADSRVAGDAALRAIASLTRGEQWLELARQAPNRPVRVAIATRLLTVGDRPALLAYLSLVYDEALRDDALTATVEMRELPIESLVAFLDHSEEPVRLATAFALGRMNRCEMTDALISRVNKRPSRSKEAWFALLACRCEAADAFLTYATRNPHLLGQLNNARVQWARVVQ